LAQAGSGHELCVVNLVPRPLMPATMGYPATFVHVFMTLALAEASVPSRATNATVKATKPHKMAALQRSTLKKPTSEGRNFLHKTQLQPITSIHCLQEKQRNPNAPCQDLPEEAFAGPIDMGNFPSWQDGICNSNYNYFCDSSNLFERQERQATLERLQLFNERMMVNCGEFSPDDDPHSNHWYDKQNPVHYGRLGLQGFRPFNLAIVVADEWPSSERDAKSMEYFGRVIMAQWGMMPIYNGVDHHNSVNKNHKNANQLYKFSEYNKNCPNAAVLFIIPKSRQVYLSSPSCKFICESRGGPEVVAATLAGLDRGGLEEAVLMGMNQVEKILQVTGERSPSAQTPFTGSKNGSFMDSDASWVLMLRLLCVLLIGLALIFAGAFVYYVMFDKARITRTTYSALTDAHGRHTLEEAFMQG